MGILLLILAAACQAVAAAPQPLPDFALDGCPGARIAWHHSMATAGDDWINDIVALRDGGYLVVGFSGRDDNAPPAERNWAALIAKFSGGGRYIDYRGHGGGAIDAYWSAQENPDGSIALAGFTTRIGAGGIDGLAAEAGADMRLRRERAFGGEGYDRFTDLVAIGDGVVLVGHSQRPGEDRRRLFAVRTDRDGLPLWQRIIEGPQSIAPLYIEPAGDGGFIVAGGIGDDLLVMKLDGDGRELWRRSIGTPGAADVNHGLAVLPDGRIVVVGYSRSWGARDHDLLAATLSPAGDTLRIEMIGGAGDDRPILARADAGGRVWIVGWTRSAGAGGADLLVARLDPAGSFAPGVVTVGGPGDEHGTAILPFGDGAVLLAGYSVGAGTLGEDAFLMRLEGIGFETARAEFTVRRIL